MFRFHQIHVVVTLILIALLQVAESRAGGGGSSRSSRGGSRRRSYSSHNGSNEYTINDVYVLIGIAFLFFILAIIGSFFSIDKKVDKKHKEITTQLSNESTKEFIWDEKEIISTITQSFIDLQKAWSEQDLNFIELKLSQNLFIKWKELLTDMRNRNESNVVSNVIVNKIRFAKLEKQEKIFTVFIDAKVKDLTINLSSGKILKDQSGGFREFWTYMWGIDGWLLMEINQESESSKFF